MADNGAEFKLPVKAVNGLRKMNELKRSEQFDVAFLQAMLIGFCTLKKIKADDTMDKNILEVAEGAVHSYKVITFSLNSFLILVLFDWRTNGDETRKNNFGQLVEAAIDGIKNNYFKV